MSHSHSEAIPCDSGPIDSVDYSSSSAMPLDSGPIGGGMYSSSSAVPLDSGPLDSGYGGGYSSSSAIPLDSGPLGFSGGYSSSSAVPLDSGPIGGSMYPNAPAFQPAYNPYPGDPYAGRGALITSQPTMSSPGPIMTHSDALPLSSGPIDGCPVCRVSKQLIINCSPPFT